MSWFSDYVNKAENLLNAIDSSAGDILSNSAVDDDLEPVAAETSAVSPAAYLTQKSAAPSFASRSRPSQEPPRRSTPSPPSQTVDAFALESSRLSRQLLGAATSDVPASKSPAIAPEPAITASKSRTDQALLDFLNTPAQKEASARSTPSPSLSRNNLRGGLGGGAISTIRENVNRNTREMSLDNKDSQESHSSELGAERSIADRPADDAIKAAKSFTPLSPDDDSDGSSGSSGGPQSNSRSGSKTNGNSSGPDSLSDPPFIQIPTSLSQSSSSSFAVVSPPPPPSDAEMSSPDEAPVNVVKPEALGAGTSKSRSSSNGSFVSGNVVASVVDAMNESPTSPFESEPEMIPTPPSTASRESNLRADVEEAVMVIERDPRRNVATVQRTGAAVEATVETATLGLSVSKLQLENQLLRSEIAALNDEMQSAWQQAQMDKEERSRAVKEMEDVKRRWKQSEQRSWETEQGMRQSEQRARELDNRTLELEQRLKEAAGRNEDSTAALDAKDGQLAVLRVRLDESDRDVAQLKAKCEALSAENRRLLQDHDASMATHSNAFETLKTTASQMEENMNRKNQAYELLQGEISNLRKEASEEKSEFGAMVTSLQAELGAEKSRSSALQQQVSGAQRGFDAAKKDLNEYRAKATRTLQAKEKLIASLKEGGENKNDSDENLEIDGVRSERDLLKEEVDSLRAEVETIRMELADAESQSMLDQDAFNEQIETLTNQWKDAEERFGAQTFDVSKLQQELACAHDELHRVKIEVQTKLQNKEEECDELRRRLDARAATVASQPDAEQRLHALTENLIEKQTTIESLATEKSSLKLQLERLQASAAASSSSATLRPAAVHVPIGDDDDRDTARMRLPMFLRETPQDTGVTRGVKRAAFTLDTLGVRIGVFFRRYPVARVIAIVYAVLLHLWVLIVLLTYSPEIH